MDFHRLSQLCSMDPIILDGLNRDLVEVLLGKVSRAAGEAASLEEGLMIVTSIVKKI